MICTLVGLVGVCGIGAVSIYGTDESGLRGMEVEVNWKCCCGGGGGGGGGTAGAIDHWCVGL